MSTTTPDAPAQNPPAGDADATEDQQPKPTETVDFWKQKAREQEKRAKENAAAAKRLQELEDAQKTAEQKAADQLTAATRRAEEAEKRSTALAVATEHRLGADDAQLLAGMADEDSMRSLAKRLADAADKAAADEDAKRRRGPSVPSQGKDTGPDPKADADREYARRLFRRDP